jgi:hypothetical protein
VKSVDPWLTNSAAAFQSHLTDRKCDIVSGLPLLAGEGRQKCDLLSTTILRGFLRGFVLKGGSASLLFGILKPN